MRVAILSGGVGGARMARGFDRIEEVELSVIVNVGDDASNHGLHISPDLDTVMYTLAGLEGPNGWGRSDDTFVTNDELGRLGVDNEFRIGDRDLAVKLARTGWLRNGVTLSEATERLRTAFGVEASILPATDDHLRTIVGLVDDEWVSFQEYFVVRGHADVVKHLRFEGAADSDPAPGVLAAIETADLVLIAPSNPPLSIWPVLAVPELREAVASHPRTVAVSPLIEGRALKGPADRVLRSMGLGEGNAGVAAAYEGLIDTLVVHNADAEDEIEGVRIVSEETRIGPPEAAERLARAILTR